MVKNELNRTPYSPFACRKGERLNVIHPRGEGLPVNLTELDRKIIVLINSALVTTSHLLGKHLAQLGWEEKDQNIRAALDRLFRNKYLIKMEFMTSETRSLTKVFALGKYGKEYIRSVGQFPNRTKLVSTLDATKAKKLLSAQQYLIWANHIAEAQEVAMAAMVTEVVKPGYHTDYCFRPQAVVQLKDSKTIFVEVVRNEPLAVKELCEKLYRMERTVSGLCSLNMPVRHPEVVLVCETEAHQKAVEEQLLQEGCGFNFPLYLTNDAQTFGDFTFGESKRLYRYPGEKRLVVRFMDSLCTVLERVFE